MRPWLAINKVPIRQNVSQDTFYDHGRKVLQERRREVLEYRSISRADILEPSKSFLLDDMLPQYVLGRKSENYTKYLKSLDRNKHKGGLLWWNNIRKKS